MNAALLTGLVWLTAMTLLFLAAQRWLHRQIHAIFLMITRRPGAALGLFSLLFFPGVLLHETSHFLAALLLRVRTGHFSLMPQVLPNGTLRLGYVETARTDVVRDALIGTAPLLVGGAVVVAIGGSLLPALSMFDDLAAGRLAEFWTAVRGLPAQPDFWLWFYLLFTISSMMLPSASDRRAWLPILLTLGGLTILALAAGAGTWMMQNLAPGLEVLVHTLAAVFAVSLGVHLALGLPIGLLAALVGKITGLRVV
jgi:hypothetical protein